MKVSVLMAVNKDDGFLNEAIQSIISQSYSNFEFVIVANNCTDSLWSAINAWAEKDCRIKPFRIKIGGLAFALNYGIEQAHGDYILRMDADDIAMPDLLEKKIAFLQANPEIDVLGSQSVFINKRSDIVESILPTKNPKEHIDIVEKFTYKNTIQHPSVFFKKQAVISAGGYIFGYYAEDWDLWIRLWLNGAKFHNLSDVLIKYRLHGNQMTAQSFNSKSSSEISGMLWLHYKKTKNKKFLFGILVQTRFFYWLIHSTYRLRKSF